MKTLKKIFLADSFILALIVSNAILIFIQEFEVRIHITNILESIFTSLFLIELIVKVNEYGIKKYLSSNWNRLDFFLIVISIPSLASLFMRNGIVTLNFLLVLRILRVFKFFRLIRFFPNIESLISGIQRALKASYLVMFGYFSLIFIFSIISCTLFKDVAPEYFNNPLNSFYSIFRLFSIEGWYEIPDIIAARTNPIIGFLSKMYFILLLLGGGILGLSLVNSIFVDAMVSDNNDNLTEKVENIEKKIDEIYRVLQNDSNKQS